MTLEYRWQFTLRAKFVTDHTIVTRKNKIWAEHGPFVANSSSLALLEPTRWPLKKLPIITLVELDTKQTLMEAENSDVHSGAARTPGSTSQMPYLNFPGSNLLPFSILPICTCRRVGPSSLPVCTCSTLGNPNLAGVQRRNGVGRWGVIFRARSHRPGPRALDGLGVERYF